MATQPLSTSSGGKSTQRDAPQGGYTPAQLASLMTQRLTRRPSRWLFCVRSYANVVRFGTEYLSEDGCIVLVSGTPAKRAKAGQISLASVGASVEHLTRTVAAELAPRRINCVSPGLIGTPMHTDGSVEKEQSLLDRTAGNLIPRAVSPRTAATRQTAPSPCFLPCHVASARISWQARSSTQVVPD